MAQQPGAVGSGVLDHDVGHIDVPGVNLSREPEDPAIVGRKSAGTSMRAIRRPSMNSSIAKRSPSETRAELDGRPVPEAQPAAAPPPVRAPDRRRRRRSPDGDPLLAARHELHPQQQLVVEPVPGTEVGSSDASTGIQRLVVGARPLRRARPRPSPGSRPGRRGRHARPPGRCRRRCTPALPTNSLRERATCLVPSLRDRTTASAELAARRAHRPAADHAVLGHHERAPGQPGLHDRAARRAGRGRRPRQSTLRPGSARSLPSTVRAGQRAPGRPAPAAPSSSSSAPSPIATAAPATAAARRASSATRRAPARGDAPARRGGGGSTVSPRARPARRAAAGRGRPGRPLRGSRRPSSTSAAALSGRSPGSFARARANTRRAPAGAPGRRRLMRGGGSLVWA